MLSSYRELCTEILNLEPIRSATVITMDGSILFSEHKKDIQSLLSLQDAEASVFRAAIRMGTRKEFLPQLGGINFALADYGKIKQYTIPLDQEVKVLLVVSETKNAPDNTLQHSIADDPPDMPSTLKQIIGILVKYGLR